MAAAASAEQRDKAVRARSLMLADLGQQRDDAQDFGAGMQLGAAALTNPYSNVLIDAPEAQRVLRNALWNFKELHLLTIGPRIDTRVVLFSPDGSKLLTGSDDGVARLWDVSTGQLIKAMVGHTGNISAAAFSPDGSLIATGDSSGGMHVWRGDNGEPLHALPPHDDMVTSLEFSSNGERLLSAS